jgi:hypothetical protein
VFLVVALSWAFVLVTHVLSQQSNGLTKSECCMQPASRAHGMLLFGAVFLFWVQTLLVMLSGSHSAFNWYFVLNACGLVRV